MGLDFILIPTDDLALSEQMNRRKDAREQGKKLLVNKKIVPDVTQAQARMARYITDFVPAATVAGLAGWLSMPLAVVGTPVAVFANNVPAALIPQCPNTSVWVFFGVHILTGGQPVSLLDFFKGPTGGIPYAQFDLEPLYSKMTTSGYFSTPVAYAPDQFCSAMITPRVATGVGCRVVLDCYVCEPDTTTIAS